MLVSDGVSIRHVGLRWGMAVSDVYPMKYVEVSDQTCRSCMGFR